MNHPDTRALFDSMQIKQAIYHLKKVENFSKIITPMLEQLEDLKSALEEAYANSRHEPIEDGDKDCFENPWD